MNVVRYTAVGGTWSWNGTSAGQWYDPGSPWALYVRQRGLAPWVDDLGRPFVWDGDLDGWQVWRRLFGARPSMGNWQAAARALYAWLVPPLAPDRRVPGHHVHVITHSHGAQPAIIAAAEGLKINTLITIAAPVRDDILREYGAAARANIRYWLSVHADRSDWTAWLGGIGDGRLSGGLERPHPLADHWHRLPRAGHSRVLRDPAWFRAWDAWCDLLHERDADAA